MTIKEFVEEARNIHGNKYDYQLVDFVRKIDKVKIVCLKHGVFEQTVKLHLRGHGCRECGIENRASECRFTKERFIEMARGIHGDNFDYSKIEYVNSITPVKIICNSCRNIFEQRPSNHINLKQGCPFCHGNNKKTNEEFIKDAKKIHGDKYDYTKTEYKGNKGEVCIICHCKDKNGVEHGEFLQTALTHLQGHGCPKCGNYYRRSEEEFIREAKRVHGGLYDYSEVEYKNNQSEINIVCHKRDKNGIEHGVFEQVAKSHLRGDGCPKCNQSKIEQEVMFLLESNSIKYIYQARSKDLKWLGLQSLDFYLPDYDVAIECQGIQHFKPIDFFGGEEAYLATVKRDRLKYNKCRLNNTELVYYIDKNLVEETNECQKYGNIYSKENTFSDLTIFSKKYLLISE